MVGRNRKAGRAAGGAAAGTGDRYKWVALSNTTTAVFMSALDGSIVIIALPAIFRGIQLDPPAPGNIVYLLWMIMGYRLVQAVLVVTLGRLGDMFGRVRIYNAGFAVFTAASVLLSFDPFHGTRGALWLIGWRVPQAVGGAMLTANSAAILTDAFPADRRGFALGTNQVAAIAGQFIGLVAGGVLASLDWRAVFWVNVPVGIFGTLWAYRMLRDNGERHPGRIDWWGNITFASGLSAILIGITDGLQPYAHHTMGWTNPEVIGLLAGGAALLAAFAVIESRVTDPMFQLGLFRIRAFTAGNIAGLAVAIARGGLQFMLIIWLQGIWLPLHGYNYSQTPFWAGIFLLPVTIGILISGPLSGVLSDRFGARGFATAGMAVFGASFIGLMLLPVDFPYWAFALLTAANGVGGGMFAAPNSSSIMGSVPARYRGVASGMRSTYQNSGTALSIGVFFSLMIAGLAGSLPVTLTSGLQRLGVPHGIAHQIAALPPVSSLFAAVLGVNPVQHLLAASGVLASLPPASQRTLTGREFFPALISGPFHHGLTVVFVVATVLAVVAAIASLLRGGRHTGPAAADEPPKPAAEPVQPAKPAAGPLQPTRVRPGQ
ncbi:MAG TPA: MFS transporter [Streptosporangiaceae bacterium]|nr:MFS transporter [Streptosporangiaceae bacterium]